MNTTNKTLEHLQLDRRDVKLEIYAIQEKVRILQSKLLEKQLELETINEKIGEYSQTNLFTNH